MRVNLCQEFDPAKPDSEQIERILARRASLKGPRLRANCVKIFLDGAYGSHTVYLLEPYSDDSARWGSGKPFVAPERLAELVSRLDAAGLQVHMHTEGDGPCMQRSMPLRRHSDATVSVTTATRLPICA